MLLLKLKLPTMVSAFRISRDRSVRLPPAFIVCLPLIQVTLSKIWKSFWFVMSGWLLLAPRFRMFWNASCVIADVASLRLMPGMPDGVGRVGAVVDRRHQELDRRPAEAELVQPVAAERVRVVERQALRLDVAVAGAEGGARVAVRQRRRLQPVRLLVAVAREEAVARRQVVIDLDVELVVLPLLDRVDQVVVDRLPVGLRACRPCSARGRAASGCCAPPGRCGRTG